MRRFASCVIAGAIALGAAVASGGTAQAPAPPRGAQLIPLTQPPVRTAIASERMYFVMIDRYQNGNAANDNLPGYNAADPGYFHGGDFAGLTGTCTDTRRGLARIKDLGFTAIWVTPPFVNKPVQADSAGYHGYWIVDFTKIDPHFGGDVEFGAFVQCAHSLGLKVYLDVVVNHTADVIQLSSYEYGPPKTPFIPPEERNIKAPAWLNDPSNYHNRGNIDFSNCSGECLVLGDFFGLDDLATEQEDVVNGLVAVYADWIRRYKIDGFRIDTARHVDPAFFGRWIPEIQSAARVAGVPRFELFGEVFVRDAVELSTYVRNRALPNVIDFPMQDAIARFAGGSAGAGGIADRLRDDDYFTRDNVAHTPPTFIGNHDIGRAAQQVRSLGIGAAGPLVDRVGLAYSLLYLLRGAPVVYYGDEFGIIGRGGDKQARHDLFPTQVREWQTEERVGAPPIGTRSYFDEPEHQLAALLRTLGRLRDAHPALSTGATHIRRASRNLLVVSRIDPAEGREYVAAFNSSTSPQRVAIRSATPSANWTSLLGGAAGTVSVANGSMVFTVGPLGTTLLGADRPLRASRAPRPVVRVARDSLSDLIRITATVPGNAPVSVAFAVKRAHGGWQRVAVDDSPPYRAFVRPSSFMRRERIGVVAVARALNASTTVSRVVTYRPRR